MRLQPHLGVGEVAMLQIGGKVPKAAIVRLADKGDPSNQGLSRLGRAWDARHEAEAIDILERGVIQSLCGKGRKLEEDVRSSSTIPRRLLRCS